MRNLKTTDGSARQESPLAPVRDQIMLIGGGARSSVSSPASNVLPAGNIYPSGKVGKTGMMNRSVVRNDVLGSGNGKYGHGSILKAAAAEAGKMQSSGETSIAGSFTGKMVDPEEVTKAGNEHYKKGQFAEALRSPAGHAFIPF